ncbi:MAG: transglycosylase SLT domain-containing protein [Nitrospiria bacterium]
MEIYQFTDPSGTIHFTNIPTDPRYRRRALTSKQSKHFERSDREKFVEEIINEASRAQQVDPALIKAIIRVESDFDTGAVSSAGAQGLMQIMPETAESLVVKNPFDPKENIHGGTRYLRSLLDRFGQDLTLALAAYNAGPNRVIRFSGVPPFKETTAYISKVNYFYEEYVKKEARNVLAYSEISPDGNILFTNRPK